MSPPELLRSCGTCFEVTTGDKVCACGTVPPYLTLGGAAAAIHALADLRDLLWPGGDTSAEWSTDTIEAVAHRLAFMRPKATPPKAPRLRSVPK